MSGSFGGALGGALGNALGGAIGGSLFGGGDSGPSTSKIRGAQHFTWTHAPSYISEGARIAGIHPLVAMGSPAYTSNPSVGYGSSGKFNGAQAGAEVGSAIGQHLGGKAGRRAAKLRQIKLDEMNLLKHRAEISVLQSEANRNNALAQQYVGSVKNRLKQEALHRKDLNVLVEPAREERIPDKGHWVKHPVTNKPHFVSPGTTRS